VVATPVGQLFLRRAASIVHEMRRAREEVEQFGGSTAGNVTAGLSIATHLALLPPALLPFTRRFPNAKLHIIEGFYPTLEPGLRAGSVDFYLGVDPGQTVAPELTREVISQNSRIVLCRSGHPLQTATKLAALGEVKWATNSITLADEDELGALFQQHCLPPPRIALRSQSALTLMTCLLNSDFMAIVPVQWTESALAKGRLTTVPVREELAAPPVVLIKRSDLVPTPVARCFLDLLLRTQMHPPMSPAAAPGRPHRGRGGGPGGCWQ
jgi:DNA-binding transcriptional LysR family regulator